MRLIRPSSTRRRPAKLRESLRPACRGLQLIVLSGRASLSTDPRKKVPRNEPKIKPPFANTSMNKL
jgi:hypothetical protein